MRLDLIAAIAGVGAGALVTTLVAKQEVGQAAQAAFSRLGIPTQVLGAVGANDPLEALAKLDPASATQVETAWMISVLGGAAAAVAAYVLVDNLLGP